MRFRVGKRLGTVAAFVPPGSRVADVGSDHARLALGLLASGRASHCVATDVRPLRLPSAAGTAVDRGSLECRTGDGLEPLHASDRLDVVALCGLGTRTIERILDPERRSSLRVRRWVLQPQTEWARLRRWLHRQGLAIDDERLVEERGRFYLIVAAVDRDVTTTVSRTGAFADEVGPVLLRHGDTTTRRYWQHRQRWAAGLQQAARTPEALHRADRDLRLAARALALLERAALV